MILGLPNINIEFKQQGASAVARGDRGIVALILLDAVAGEFTIYDVTDIPANLAEENKVQIQNALLGNTTAPIRVEVKVLVRGADGEAVDISDALDYFSSVKFDYLAMPEVTEAQKVLLTSWIKSLRDTEGRKAKVVLAATQANHEGIINFNTTDIKVKDIVYTADLYCARIAGFIAGTSLQIATTFGVLPEVEGVPLLTKQALSEAVGRGEFVLFKENGKVKVARGVTSFTEVSAAKGDAYRKIKIVDILDIVHNDIQKTMNDSYIGKYANSYDNKCILATSIQGYFEGLELDGLLETGVSTCGIDLAAQKAYLKSIGVDVNSMNDDEVKVANTKDQVFLIATIKPLDAIEEISLKVII